MSKPVSFTVTEDEKLPPAIANLHAEYRIEADKALEDRKIRSVVYSDEAAKAVSAIGRYVETQGRYTVRPRMTVEVVNGEKVQLLKWQVVDKRPAREMTPEHKAKLLAARQAAREAKKAAESNGHSEAVQGDPRAARTHRSR